MKLSYTPERIVCLTEEPTETLYLLGEQDRIVGISGFTVRPPEARRDKPRVSAFTCAKLDKILALEPDLVLGFSDLQADIAAALIRAGLEVYIFNQRTVQEIQNSIQRLGNLVGAADKAAAWLCHSTSKLELLRQQACESTCRRPRIYFEEWDDPMITGIRWVSELIEIAGAEDCFRQKSFQSLGKDRIIAQASEVIAQMPDIIIGSWCGKKFRPEKVKQRPGWHQIPAVANDQLFEIKSSNILQPGPAALTDGLDHLVKIVRQWQLKFS